MKKLIAIAMFATLSLANANQKLIFPDIPLSGSYAYNAGYDDGIYRREYYNPYTEDNKRLYDIGFLDGTMEYITARMEFICTENK